MEKRRIRVWQGEADCGSAGVVVHYTLPDTFFDVELFTCMACGALFCVDRERDRYGGVPFESLRSSLRCPECSMSLRNAVAYPQTFRCPDGGEGHFHRPGKYPSDEELVDIEVWDAYS